MHPHGSEIQAGTTAKDVAGGEGLWPPPSPLTATSKDWIPMDCGGKGDSVRRPTPVSQLFPQNNLHSEPREAFQSLASNNAFIAQRSCPAAPKREG